VASFRLPKLIEQTHDPVSMNQRPYPGGLVERLYPPEELDEDAVNPFCQHDLRHLL